MKQMFIIPESALDAGARMMRCIQSGRVLAHATETCYGLACDLRSLKPVERLFAMKKRPPDQPVSALFPSLDAAEAYVEISPLARELAKKYLPGPLTLVLPRKPDAPLLHVTASGGGTDPWVGVRISSHPVAVLAASAAGAPIATTSANLHGFQSPYDVAELRRQFEDTGLWPDLTVDSGLLPETPSSTVVRVEGEKVTMLRQGSIRPE